MQVNFEIAPETAARFAAEAERRGIPLDRLLSETLESCARERPPQDSRAGETEDRERRRLAVDAMLGFAGKHGVTTGGQDIKSMIHEEHKY